MLPGEPTSRAAADIPHSAEVLGIQTFLTGVGLETAFQLVLDVAKSDFTPRIDAKNGRNECALFPSFNVNRKPICRKEVLPIPGSQEGRKIYSSMAASKADRME